MVVTDAVLDFQVTIYSWPGGRRTPWPYYRRGATRYKEFLQGGRTRGRVYFSDSIVKRPRRAYNPPGVCSRSPSRRLGGTDKLICPWLLGGSGLPAGHRQTSWVRPEFLSFGRHARSRRVAASRPQALAMALRCGEGVPPLCVAGILPASRKSKAKMASPRRSHRQAALDAATRSRPCESQGFGTNPTCLSVPPVTLPP